MHFKGFLDFYPSQFFIYDKFVDFYHDYLKSHTYHHFLLVDSVRKIILTVHRN